MVHRIGLLVCFAFGFSLILLCGDLEFSRLVEVCAIMCGLGFGAG